MDEIQEPALPADVGLPGKSGYADGVDPDLTDFRWPGPSRGRDRRRRGLAAPLALPAGFGALLVVGAVAAASRGGLSAGWVLLLAAIIVAVGAAVAEPAVAPVLGAIGWLTVAGFSRAPYAQVQVSAPGMARAALVIAACTAGGVAVGVIVRQLASSFTLWIVDVSASQPEGDQLLSSERADRGTARRQRRIADLSGGIGVRRVLVGVLLVVAGLPLLTVALSAHGLRLDLGDDLLIYLVAVVAVAVVGGFWPAVLAAITASLLVNWYFTPPVHTLTIADGKSLLALLLFVTVAVTVSSVVHLAALRARQAARSTEEAAGPAGPGADGAGRRGHSGCCARPSHHKPRRARRAAGTHRRAVGAGRRERCRARQTPRSCGRRRGTTCCWRSLASIGRCHPGCSTALPRRLRRRWTATGCGRRPRRRRRWLRAIGCGPPCSPRSAMTCGHRSPRSRPASARCARRTWSGPTPTRLRCWPPSRSRADRLDALIGNLLDMSRLTTGSLQPFLRPTAIDEVAPVALRGLDGGSDTAHGGTRRAAAGAHRSRPAGAGARQPVRQRAGLLAGWPAAGLHASQRRRQRAAGDHRSWPRRTGRR